MFIGFADTSLKYLYVNDVSNFKNCITLFRNYFPIFIVEFNKSTLIKNNSFKKK